MFPKSIAGRYGGPFGLTVHFTFQPGFSDGNAHERRRSHRYGTGAAPGSFFLFWLDHGKSLVKTSSLEISDLSPWIHRVIAQEKTSHGPCHYVPVSFNSISRERRASGLPGPGCEMRQRPACSQELPFCGFSSTAFLASSSPRFGSNQGSSGPRANVHAKLL